MCVNILRVMSALFLCLPMYKSFHDILNHFVEARKYVYKYLNAYLVGGGNLRDEMIPAGDCCRGNGVVAKRMTFLHLNQGKESCQMP